MVYDYMANPVLLRHARPGCELICAGKRSGHHAMEQLEINHLLSRLALEGKTVCRLKGGDPFIFGRGGEEALYLAECGIPFELVPGVSSAVAVPAYAGIPVTHRGLSASVRIVTGHRDPDKVGGDVDWDAIAQSGGTLVVLMGLRNLAAIARRLMAGTWPAETPAAVILKGSYPTQQSIVGCLADIAAKAESAGASGPAVFITGAVVSLREDISWHERKPLFGRAVAVTGEWTEDCGIAEALMDPGAEVIHTPVIRLESLAAGPALQEAVSDLGRFQWLLFDRADCVNAFFEALEYSGRDTRALAGLRIAAVGDAAAARLRLHGVRPDLAAEPGSAEALVARLAADGALEGKRLLMPQSASSPQALLDAFERRGAVLESVLACQASPEVPVSGLLFERLEAGTLDLVLFRSAPAVECFAQALSAAGLDRLRATIPAAGLGPETASALTRHGLPICLDVAVAAPQELLRAVREFLETAAPRPAP